LVILHLLYLQKRYIRGASYFELIEIKGERFSSMRVSAYIDGANLFHAGEAIGIRIDYAKLIPIIVNGRTQVDLNYYDSTENSPAELNFFAKIGGFGYTLKLVKLHIYGSSKPEEKKIDTQIVADSLVDGLIGSRFDICVLGSGDKDILPAVEYLQKAGKNVEIMSFDHSLSWDLKICGATIISLTKLKSQILRTK
jgi:uncharacterized LabA/DUF88 family protein